MTYYENPREVERAIRKAIKASGRDSGNAYRQLLRDRFLSRIFSDEQDRYVLKGGSGMLARIPGARATRDIDFARKTNQEKSPKEIIAEFTALAERDLGDMFLFTLDNYREGMDDNGYARLLKMKFRTYIGAEEKDPIAADLALDCHMTGIPEVIKPSNRIEVPGLETNDYLLYPFVDQIADKVCATMEIQPSGYPSSRMKDLVDLVLIATNETALAGELSHAISIEMQRREMVLPEVFTAPTSWAEPYANFARKSGIEERYCDFEASETVAKTFIDPILSGLASQKTWNPNTLTWE